MSVFEQDKGTSNIIALPFEQAKGTSNIVVLPVKTIGFCTLNAGRCIEGTQWRLKVVIEVSLTIEGTISGTDVIARIHQVDEYGIGQTMEEAVTDLLSSMVEYYELLMSRESKLGDVAQRDLQALSELLERQ